MEKLTGVEEVEDTAAASAPTASAGATSTTTTTSTFVDHWSLGCDPSTTLRLRSNHIRVLNDKHHDDTQLQFVTSTTSTTIGTTTSNATANSNDRIKDNTATTTTTTTARSVTTSNFGVRLLRAVYTLVAFFVMTVLFAFAAQAILFLFMNLVAGEDSNSWTNPETISIVGAVFAFPVLLFSMGSLLTMSWSFVVDCWNGIGSNDGSLLRQMVFWNGITTEWIVFIVMGCIPLFTLIITTMSRDDDWWEITTLCWVICCGVLQLVYMLLVFINEVHICKYIVQKYGRLVLNRQKIDVVVGDDDPPQQEEEEVNATTTRPTLDDHNHQYHRYKGCVGEWVWLAKTNILITQRQKYSGLQYQRFLVRGDDIPPTDGYSSSPNHRPVQYYWKLFSRWTTVATNLTNAIEDVVTTQQQRRQCCCYTTLSPPQRNYTINEVFGNIAIIGGNDWSMERLFCLDRTRGTMITLRQGTEAVTSFQVGASHACIAVSLVLITLAVAGFLTWAGQSAVVIVIVLLVVFGCCLLPMVISSYISIKYDHGKLGGTSESEPDDQQPITENKNVSTNRLSIDVEGEKRANIDGDIEIAALSTEGDGSNPKPDNDAVQSQIMEQSVVGGAAAVPVPKAEKRRMSIMELNAEQHKDLTADTAVMSVWEAVRVSQPSTTFCWIMFGLEITLFYLFPVITLFAGGNGPVATLFFFVGLFSLVRHYFNATNILRVIGPIDSLPHDFGDDMVPALKGLGGGSKDWWSSSGRFRLSRNLRSRSLIASLGSRITRTKTTKNWMSLLGFLFFFVMLGFLLAANEPEFDYKVKGVVFPPGFRWDPQPQLPYPTCQVQKGFTFPGTNSSAALADYAFLGTTAFAGPDEAQSLLDDYFGTGVVFNDYEFVQGYRNATDTASHPVTYSLYTFPDLPDSAVVSIRGSESMWDWMVDIQLWTGSVLAQLIRNVNPLGYWIWTPILDEVVWFINRVQSKRLKEVSYYRYTSQFVNDLSAGSYDGRQYDLTNIRVTGTSLGGGLAILTGAITGASAIANSGLNAMFSRRTFDPPITKEQLDTRTFNTIPERDIIASIDEPGQLFQRMQCRGPKNSLFGCHSMYRSLCEIQYQCGSNGRPINCWCTSKYGYPYPTQTGSMTWEEACADAPDWTPTVASAGGQ